MNSFNELGLKAELLRAVSESGYTEPTPIQVQVIPVVLEGRDVMATAQTGTGKTAGFTLPLLQRLSQQPGSGPRKPRALILTPTRELAAQVSESVRTYGKHLPLKAVALFGGVGIVPQIKSLRDGRDIVIATPGRLLDHVQQRTIDLTRIEVLVLDEADRMLDMGFIRDIHKILALLPRERQNLLFSATFSAEIRELAQKFLRNPATIEAARRTLAAEGVTHVVHPVQAGQKRALLSHLIQTNSLHQVLVFTRTKHGADRLARQLKSDGIGSDALHGNKSQSQRTRALEDFKRGRVAVLVATDIAARGLDIDQLPQVVNFDLPHVPEDYVHRIGRTGRAGATGNAISLVCAEESAQLRAIERILKQSIEVVNVAGFDSTLRAAAKPRPAGRSNNGHNPAKRSFGSERPARQGQPGQGRPGRSRDANGANQPTRFDRYETPRPSQGRNEDRPARDRQGNTRTGAGQRTPGQQPGRGRFNTEVPALVGDGMAFRTRRSR